MYHNTTNERVSKATRKRIRSQEEYVYSLFRGRLRGWTSDELYHYINSKLTAGWEKQLRRMVWMVHDSKQPTSVIPSMVTIIDREFVERNSRKTNVKRSLSDLCDSGLIYRSDDKRKATTGKMCYVYKMKEFNNQ